VSRIVAIGERQHVGGFELAGVHVAAADGPDAARVAWQALPADAELVILTDAAHAALACAGLLGRDQRLWVVMPR